jgi:sRNA-binding carbon storage regulator CsrA
MLVLSMNRHNEARLITANVEIVVHTQRGENGRVQLVIDAPKSVTIYRPIEQSCATSCAT